MHHLARGRTDKGTSKMAWLYMLSILVLDQVVGSQSVSDSVTVTFQLSSYSYSGEEFQFKSPLFYVLVEEGTGRCDEEYRHKTSEDFDKFLGKPTQNSTSPPSPNLQFHDNRMEFPIPLKDYNQTIYLLVKQKYNNKNVSPGESDATYYCSVVNTSDLVNLHTADLTSKKNECQSCRISVKLVAQCPEHYFGAQCETYCSPSDSNTAGHYTCGSDGEKICVEGYEGESCTDNIPDCVNVTCLHGGTCQDGIGNYTCACTNGFDGLNCERNIDDCVGIVCQNGGTCLDDIGNYTCVCKNGFDGLNCERNIDDCVGISCQNGGTCQDGIGNYTCACTNGFNGLNCERNIDDCVGIVCQNGGTCLDDIGNYTCACKNGFDGLNCERNIDDCVGIVCQNGGTCLDDIGNYTCVCKNGFDGLNCERNIDDCVGIVCQNGGTCLDDIGNYICVCKNGFDGLNCERNIDDCVGIVCQNGGTCQDDIGNYTCVCKNGFDGLNCEINVNDCASITCQHGGTCQDGIGNYTCLCTNGYDGINCQHRSPTPSPNVPSPSESTLYLEQSTHKSSVTLPPESSISHEQTSSSTQRATVSLPPKSTFHNSEQTSPTPRPLVTQPSKFNFGHPTTTHRTLSPKIDNESSPQKAVGIAPIAGGAAGGVIALVIVVVLVVKCRGKQPRQRSQTDQLQSKHTTLSYNSTNGVDLHINGHTNPGFQQDGQITAEREKCFDNSLYHEDERTQL